MLNTVTPNYEDKVEIYKVNIEDEPEITSLFGVRTVPQVSMIRKDGRTEKEIGAMNVDQLKYWLEGLTND